MCAILMTASSMYFVIHIHDAYIVPDIGITDVSVFCVEPVVMPVAIVVIT